MRHWMLCLLAMGCGGGSPATDEGRDDTGASDTGTVEDSGDTDDTDTDTDDTDPPVTTAGCAMDRWDPADFDTVHDVGPGQALASPNDVPWESVGPGTLVRIWPGTEPYRAKWVLDAPGTEDNPVVVIGVCDPSTGAIPVIEGGNATTRTELNYWSETRGIIKIGGASVPGGDTRASWIYVEDLELRGARGSFTDDAGNADTYQDNASAVFVEQGDHITLRGNMFADSGNGLFVAHDSTDIRVIGNHIYDNGVVDSIYEHNSYTEARGILFEGNRYGALCAGCPGNNLKDRSSGTVVRYNWIAGGNRQLDLVDSGHAEILDDPAYGETLVLGNVLIEPDGAGNSQIVHYGGDSGDTTRYRNGTLWFVHNTVLSERPGNTTLIRLSADGHEAHIENSIVYAAGNLALLEASGVAHVEDSWLSEGWVTSHSSFNGTLTEGTVITGTDPGWMDMAGQDVALAAGSPAIGAAGSVDAPESPTWEWADDGLVSRGDSADLGALSR